MHDLFTSLASKSWLPATADEARQLAHALDAQCSRRRERGVVFETSAGWTLYFDEQHGVFLTGEHVKMSQIPSHFLQRMGEYLRGHSQLYAEFGAVYCANQIEPGHCTGTDFRINYDGQVLWPEWVWPTDTIAFRVGTRVSWASQAKGHTKTKQGIIIAAVPAGESPVIPQGYSPGGKFGYSRRQDSFLVAVGKKVYWPRVVHLKALPPV